MRQHSLKRGLVAMCSSAALAGCAGAHSGFLAPSGPLTPAAKTSGQQFMSPASYAQSTKSYPSATFSLTDSGGRFKLPSYRGFRGSGGYSGNNAPSGATMTVTNSGANNPLGVPLPPDGGTPVLFLEATVGESSSVTFDKLSKHLVNAVSTSFQLGQKYEVDVYEGSAVLSSNPYTVATSGTLTFPTPFSSGVTINAATPVIIEISLNPYPQTLYAIGGYNPAGIILYDGDSFGSGPQNFLSMPNTVGANALAVDDSQNLYAGSCWPGNCFVNEYTPALQGITSYYMGAGLLPGSIAAGSGSSATVFAVAAINPIFAFAQGNGNPESTVVDPNLQNVFALAVDGAGNEYVSGSTGQAWEVDLSQPGGQWTNLGLTLSAQPNALMIDTSGNLLVAEVGVGVAVFPPGDTIPSYIGYGANTFSFALGDAGNWLYTVQYGAPNAAAITVYRYPSGSVLGQYSNYIDYGARQIAVAPRVALFNPAAMRRANRHFKYWTDIVSSQRQPNGR